VLLVGTMQYLLIINTASHEITTEFKLQAAVDQSLAAETACSFAFDPSYTDFLGRVLVASPFNPLVHVYDINLDFVVCYNIF